MTHEEIAKLLGISRQRVHQIERRAMTKLRKAAGSKYFGPYKIQESCGVPEPAEGYRDYAKASANQPRRGGRFA